MSRRVSRTKRFCPATLQSCTALLIACATWEALHPAAAMPASASAAAAPVHRTRRARPARILRMVPPAVKGTTTFRPRPLQSGVRASRPSGTRSGAGQPSMPVALKDEEIHDAERRARAALRTAPPTLTPGDGPNVYALEAQREVLEFIREGGPPAG